MADDKLLAQFLEWAAKLSDEEVLHALKFLARSIHEHG
jgi:hypothetical protein